MSIKLKCQVFLRKNLLNTLTVLLASGTLFTVFPFIKDIYNVDADLISQHPDTETQINLDERLTLFHDNTILAKSEIKADLKTTTITSANEKNIVVQQPLTVVSVINVSVTGYSSTVDQTNSQPFITASGYRVRDGIVAANFLPFGTKIRIPEAFGDKVFVVKDRMNSRFNNRVDVWFYTRQQALNFGIKYTYIEVVETAN